jgi:hypothetical protein
VQCFGDIAGGFFIGGANTFFATLKAHPDRRNAHSQALFMAFVNQADMVVQADLLEHLYQFGIL